MGLDAVQAEETVVAQGAQLLNDRLIAEWQKQGHHLTGAWEESVKFTIIGLLNGTQATGTMNDYGGIIDAGVNPDRIPYGGASTGAKTSKYITGLVTFWQLRGLSEKEAIRAAFATAKKQKIDGMPTSGSYRFSENGQRTQFIEIVDSVASGEVNDLICEGLDNIVDELFNETESETI